MDELEQAMRETLNDERLELRARPGAVAAVHEGVRRRRRRRTTMAVASVASVVAGSAVGIALLTTAGTSSEGPVTPPSPPTLQYDVPWVGLTAPKLWSPKPIYPKLPTLVASPCRGDQLAVVKSTHQSGADSDLWYILLRNVSNQPCKLIGSPMAVIATDPGQPDVVGSRGLSLGHGGVGGDLKPANEGYLTVETPHNCSGWPSAKTARYYTLVVTLPSLTAFTAHMPLDAACGLLNGGLGVWSHPRATHPIRGGFSRLDCPSRPTCAPVRRSSTSSP